MTFFDWLQIGLYLLILFCSLNRSGAYMARVFQGERVFLTRVVSPVERFIYRILGIRCR